MNSSILRLRCSANSREPRRHIGVLARREIGRLCSTMNIILYTESEQNKRKVHGRSASGLKVRL